MKHHVLFLTRRNLETLLSKLDRKQNGEETMCTIIKYKNSQNPAEYQQTMEECSVVAVEDADFYVNRPAGAMLPQDEPELRHDTGTAFNISALD